jgi:small conductance mechanosensitive channel
MDVSKINWGDLLEKLVEFGGTWGLRVLGVLITLFVAWIVAGWSRKALVRSLDRRKFDVTLTRFFGNLVRYAILAGVVIGCLGVFGIQTASFAAVIGALGLAIGLAFQGTLSNFAAGVMLMVFRPFKAGDFVSVTGQMGVVREVELFTTEITTLDNRRVIVPNTSIFGNVIENFTHYDVRRVDVPVGVDYGADVDKTREVLEAMAGSIPGVLEDPAPQIFLGELGASSVDWQVRVWCRTEEYWDVYQAAIRAAKRALDDAGLGIPFPQMDVHLDDDAVKALAGRR